jgi:hypothetical protein
MLCAGAHLSISHAFKLVCVAEGSLVPFKRVHSSLLAASTSTLRLLPVVVEYKYIT